MNSLTGYEACTVELSQKRGYGQGIAVEFGITAIGVVAVFMPSRVVGAI